MPEKIASHWNAKGQADGYMSKFWGLFLMPIISLGMFLLFLIIPRIDPLKANVAQFRKYFNRFIVLMTVFLFYLYLLTISWNLGARFNLVHFLAPAFAMVFYYAGVLTENAKRNWFIGIRTPWTLSSEAVWDKTHKLGGRLLKVSGVIALFGVLFQDLAIFLTIIPAISASFYLFIYSYLEYRKEKNSL
jgi:uncharacterized membrane protein